MNNELLNRTLVADQLMREAPWSGSHGADGDHLGFGLLYYALVYALKARVAVCLGSGGGFVPRLMRQAQRDLGIAGSSRTILVDANKPDAGWGSPSWLSPVSFFRTSYPDVEILLDTTSHAATAFFGPNRLIINYLHIDADHSLQACLNDFQTYRPFLRDGSVVTLHDTNFPRAGVRHVVDHVRTLGDCEVIDFPDVGVGTALVRIRGPVEVSYQEHGAAPGPSADGLIGLVRRPDAVAVTPPFKAWKYLESRAFSTRYVLAAHFLRSCRSVVEIGGSATPIDAFLTGAHESVLVVDPLIREGYSDTLRGRACRVAHVPARFQDVDWVIPDGADFGLVMLGLEIQGMEPHHYETLFRLVNQAKVVVIEFPPSWPASVEQFEKIRAETRTRVGYHAVLDLSDNDFGDLGNSWPPRCIREVYVLEPA
jgi:hypothetical protein